MARIKKLTSHVWHPNTQMSEWGKFDSICKGDGVWLVDSKGHKMIDGVASMWCNVWGHSNKELVDAMRTQMQVLQHSPLFNLTHKPAEVLARKLIKMSPGMHRVMYSDNGSTAIEVALKIAFQYWANVGERGRTTIASLNRGYHGDTYGAMSVGQIPEFFAKYGQHMICNSIKLPVPTRSHMNSSLKDQKKYGSSGGDGDGDGDESNTQDKCISEISDILSHRNDIAAIIMESGVQMAGGVQIYTRTFQNQISRICKEHDILLIIDEVATGFGRLGPMCVYESENSDADIVVYGKMLTGGYFPLAATLTSKRIYDAFLGKYEELLHLFHGHTFTGNPIATATANKNITMYAKHGLIRHIKNMSQVFNDYIDEFFRIDAVGNIKHKGMVMGIELIDSGKPICSEPSMNYIIYQMGRKNGVYLRTLGSVVMIVPPLAIAEHELIMLLERTQKTIKDAIPALLRAPKSKNK